MYYPREIEERLHRRLKRGDLAGARLVLHRLVCALREKSLLPAVVLAQMLHTCVTQIEQELVRVFDVGVKLPSRLETAQLFSRQEGPAAIISAFDHMTSSLFSVVEALDLTSNSVPHKTRTFIDQNFAQDISTRSVAAEVCYSEAYVCATFKEAYGITVGQYIRQRRIGFAKTLLAASHKPVKAICYETGYSTYRTFLRAFHAEVGTSPSEYRRARAKNTSTESKHGTMDRRARASLISDS